MFKENILGKLRRKIRNNLFFVRNLKPYLFHFLVILFLVVSLVVSVFFINKEQEVSVEAGNVNLSLTAPQTSMNKNVEFPVFVYIDTKGSQVTGVDLEVKFDKDKLEALKIETLQTYFLPVVFIPGSISTSEGLVKIVLGCKPDAPKTGTGVLAKITFKTKNVAGVSKIDFNSDTAISALGSTTNVIGQKGSIDITIIGSTTTPTSTPTVMPTPTTTVKPTVTPTSTATPTLTSIPTPSNLPGNRGDVNQDGLVNIIDIGIVIDNYDLQPPTNPRADINQDNSVNIIDIGIVIDNYDL